MGYYTEHGKQFDIFNPDFPYKVKLLYGFRYEYNYKVDGESAEEIVYICKAHGQTYMLYKSNYGFNCKKHTLNEMDIDEPREIIGIGLDVEITVDDLDAMFGDWENYAKKLKPVNDETMAELLEAVPELKEPLDLTMEDVFVDTSGRSYEDMKKELDKLHAIDAKDIKNALGALLYNLSLDGRSKKEDATKVDGKYTRVIKHGEIWIVQFTRGVGHEIQGVRPALVISDNGRNARLGTIMCLAIEGYPATYTYNQVEIDKNNDVIYSGSEKLTKAVSRVELTEVMTLDRSRFLRKLGRLKPDKVNEVLTLFKKYYKLPNVLPEPVELDFGFDEDETE